MSTLFTSRELCERVLRRIGTYSTYDTGADPEQLRETMFWLDLNLAQLSGSTRILRFVSAEQSIALDANTQSYDLGNEIGDGLDNGIQFPVGARLVDSSGNRYPLTIVPRSKYLAQSDLAQSGTPEMVYIDRTGDPQMYVWPVSADSDEWTVYLTVQTFAPSVASKSAAGANEIEDVAHGISEVWQRWAVLKTAADVGDGPVIKREAGFIQRLEEGATDAMRALLAFENRSHDTERPVTEPYGYG